MIEDYPIAIRPASDVPPVVPRYVAVIGDMVGSRKLAPEQRRQAQVHFTGLMEELNQEFESGIAGKFAITQGDEFEALFRSSSVAEHLPTLVWRIWERFPTPAVRLGIGLGTVDTEIPVPAQSSITLDGSAFHRARAAVQQAAKEKQLGGVFLGFGKPSDSILNGLAHVLAWQRSRWTRQQRTVVGLLRQGLTQAAIAQQTRRWKQAVNTDVQATGWKAYADGERAWQLALEHSARWIEETDCAARVAS